MKPFHEIYNKNLDEIQTEYRDVREFLLKRNKDENWKDDMIVEYTRKEDLINAWTHFIGAIGSVIFMVFFMMRAISSGNSWAIVSSVIYGLTMIFLFTASGTYHFATSRDRKRRLRVLDHSSIFILIAGTYTPVCLVVLDGWIRIVSITIIWVLAILGVVLTLTSYFKGNFGKRGLLTTILYIAMGWLSVFLLYSIYVRIGWPLIIYLFVGGLLYTGGTIFYGIKSIPYNHALWHLFVLAGAYVHAVGIYLYAMGK